MTSTKNTVAVLSEVVTQRWPDDGITFDHKIIEAVFQNRAAAIEHIKADFPTNHPVPYMPGWVWEVRIPSNANSTIEVLKRNRESSIAFDEVYMVYEIVEYDVLHQT